MEQYRLAFNITTLIDFVVVVDYLFFARFYCACWIFMVWCFIVYFLKHAISCFEWRSERPWKSRHKFKK